MSTPLLRRELTLLADFHQFHLRDSAVAFAFPEHWGATTQGERHLLADGCIAVATPRPWFVPVTIEIHARKPVVDSEAWDHIVLCSIACPSLTLVAAGGPVPGRDAASVVMPANAMRALVLYGNVERLAVDAAVDDYYKILLWPGRHQEPTVIKRKQTVDVD